MEKQLIKELKNSKIYTADNLYNVVFNEKSNVEVPDANEVTAYIKEHATGDLKYGLLVDISKIFFISNEARGHFAKRRNPKFKAVSVILSSPVQKTFANMYLKFSKPTIPTKIFNDEASALTWLKTTLQ